ncbi:response regulator [Lederbergia sp. NSJ-179]|uniref:helix-turn-helix domain-containing protein n=1 Tax=Lederbergia sp. NSJ-179 TaxID=2931402 RepID=UPI001FD33F41|nr:helix-turn-helix domain-containing protein [Lederbergia sp. NSJ-179]MCJ7842551.1 response regulator [Lederbergia sp. NSJ-179]
MNVLIVDDDRFVVSVLEQKIDWTSLGIQKIYTAYNTRQARKLLIERNVDILISDIEMPQGSGLELLAWARSEGFNGQAIFLTNFADFNYAQKAIELQSFEYYLKPIEVDKFEIIIKKAVEKVQISQIDADALNVGYYWQQNKDELVEHFWHTYLNSTVSLSREELHEQLKMRQIDYSMNDCFLPVLLDFFPYTLVDHKEIISVFHEEIDLQDKIKCIMVEAFKNSSLRLDVFLTLNKDQCLAIFKWENQTCEASSEMFISFCDQFIADINTQLNCDVQCRIGVNASIDKIPSSIHDLVRMSKETIHFRNKTIVKNDTHRAHNYVEPNLRLLEHYLDTENRLSFINKCHQYLTNLLDKKALDQHVLYSFRLDITQLIYTQLKRKEILANRLFQGEIADFLLEQSSRSIDDLMIYISYLIDVSLDYIAFMNSQASVIQTICDYIDRHYQENITRSSLAKIVFLSPDYIARLFKKETGISLVNYIIEKRIEIAKDLLIHTDLPVHMISDQVGYGNYSYFTKLFKKKTNYTPIDFRKIAHSKAVK